MEYLPDQWELKFRPLVNEMNPHASWNGCLFESYGAEFQKVLDTNESYVWTWVDADNEHGVIMAGRHYVNRIGYFITEEPYGSEEDFVDVDKDDANG